MRWFKVELTILAEDEQDALQRVMQAMSGKPTDLAVDHFTSFEALAANHGATWKKPSANPRPES